MLLNRNCDQCQKEYKAESRYLKRGQGKFCSISCSTKYRKQNQPAKQHNCNCSYCGVSFYRPPSKIRSKSGYLFCSRECKDDAQGNKDFHEMNPNHYSYGETNYRLKAFRSFPVECKDCGWKEIPEILEVHHIDRNRNNNDVSNLVILCPTHHNVRHYLTSSGKWHNLNVK